MKKPAFIKKETLIICIFLVSLIAALSLFCGIAYGDTHTVSDCTDSANVNAAIAAASDGDTVLLQCTGNVTWTSVVTMPNTKGITLKVENGTNQGTPNFPLVVTTGADPQIYVHSENGRTVNRISGFKFVGGMSHTSGVIMVDGRGTGSTGTGAFRIDDNYFDTIQLPHTSLEGTISIRPTTGVMNGLIDHNTFHDASYTDGYTISITERWRTPVAEWSYAGQNTYIRDFTRGDSDYIFIENNTFENINQYTRHFIMNDMGAKTITRYNTFDSNGTWGQNDQIDAHGNCLAGTGVGAKGGEIYSNTFKGTTVGRNMNLRGGQWLIYNNVFENSDYSIGFWEYRARTSTVCAAAMASDPSWVQHVTDNTYYPLKAQITNTYLWNNTYSGANFNPTVSSDGVINQYIVLNRDYFVSTSQPAALSSYTPYTYPHPLTGGGAVPPPTDTTPPAAPTGLSVN